MKDNRTQLHELVDKLSDNQILYVMTLIKKLLGIS